MILHRTVHTTSEQVLGPVPVMGRMDCISIFSGPEGVSSVCFNGFQMSGPSPNSNLGERFLRNISPYPSHPVTASVNTPLTRTILRLVHTDIPYQCVWNDANRLVQHILWCNSQYLSWPIHTLLLILTVNIHLIHLIWYSFFLRQT